MQALTLQAARLGTTQHAVSALRRRAIGRGRGQAVHVQRVNLCSYAAPLTELSGSASDKMFITHVHIIIIIRSRAVYRAHVQMSVARSRARSPLLLLTLGAHAQRGLQ